MLLVFMRPTAAPSDIHAIGKTGRCIFQIVNILHRVYFLQMAGRCTTTPYHSLRATAFLRVQPQSRSVSRSVNLNISISTSLMPSDAATATEVCPIRLRTSRYCFAKYKGSTWHLLARLLATSNNESISL